MFGFSFIPSKVHAVIDYIVGLVLLFAPEIFGFSDIGGPAVTIPRVLGVAILVMTVLTKHELGIIKVIPLRLHLWVDIIASAFLAVSPFLFNFSDDQANVWMPHLLAGIAYLLISLVTDPVSSVERKEHNAAAA
jgi:hypothetical protein